MLGRPPLWAPRVALWLTGGRIAVCVPLLPAWLISQTMEACISPPQLKCNLLPYQSQAVVWMRQREEEGSRWVPAHRAGGPRPPILELFCLMLDARTVACVRRSHPLALWKEMRSITGERWFVQRKFHVGKFGVWQRATGAWSGRHRLAIHGVLPPAAALLNPPRSAPLVRGGILGDDMGKHASMAEGARP